MTLSLTGTYETVSADCVPAEQFRRSECDKPQLLCILLVPRSNWARRRSLSSSIWVCKHY
jgi:hypothetical protein